MGTVSSLLTLKAKVEAGVAPITASCSVQLPGFLCHLERWKEIQTSKSLARNAVRRVNWEVVAPVAVLHFQ